MEELKTTPISSIITEVKTVLPKKGIFGFVGYVLRACFKNRSFKRRISLREYQYSMISVIAGGFIINGLASLIQYMRMFGSNYTNFTAIDVVSTLVLLLVGIIIIKLIIGRLRDLGISPRGIFLFIIPLANIYFAIRLFFSRGKSGENSNGLNNDEQFKVESGLQSRYGRVYGILLVSSIGLVIWPFIFAIIMFR